MSCTPFSSLSILLVWLGTGSLADQDKSVADLSACIPFPQIPEKETKNADFFYGVVFKTTLPIIYTYIIKSLTEAAAGGVLLKQYS